MRGYGRLFIGLYIGSVVLANWITAVTVPLKVGPFIITWGSWFVACSFFLADGISTNMGRRARYYAIFAGLAITIIASRWVADLAWITVASALAFGVSETLDTEIFHRTTWDMPGRVAWSGCISGLIDTAVFVLVGLSPLTTGIVTWGEVPKAILGVWFVKDVLSMVAGLGVVAYRRRRAVARV